jgi:hypothetical protein
LTGTKYRPIWCAASITSKCSTELCVSDATTSPLFKPSAWNRFAIRLVFLPSSPKVTVQPFGLMMAGRNG